MENVINLVAYFIGETVTNLTEEQKAQHELAYARAKAVHKKDIAEFKKFCVDNDLEADELVNHWGKVKEEK